VADYSEFPTTPTAWQEQQIRDWETVTPLSTEDPEPPRRKPDRGALIPGLFFVVLAISLMAGVDLPIHVCRHKISIVLWPETERRPHPMVYDFVTSIYTRPEMGEHILVGGLDAEESQDSADPDAYREGVSLDESTDALARVSHRFPVLAEGHIARGYAGCFDVSPDWHPVLDRVGPEGYHVAAGFSGHGFKLSPAVGHMMATLITEGSAGHPDLPTFRLSRFAEGKPIRGTYGDWLMC